MSGGHAFARFLGALIAFIGVGVGAVAFLVLAVGAGHFTARHAAYLATALMAMAAGLAIAGLGATYAIQPQGRPRVILACQLLMGALAATVLFAMTPPPASLFAIPIALGLAGGAWVVGSRTEA